LCFALCDCLFLALAGCVCFSVVAVAFVEWQPVRVKTKRRERTHQKKGKRRAMTTTTTAASAELKVRDMTEADAEAVVALLLQCADDDGGMFLDARVPVFACGGDDGGASFFRGVVLPRVSCGYPCLVCCCGDDGVVVGVGFSGPFCGSSRVFGRAAEVSYAVARGWRRHGVCSVLLAGLARRLGCERGVRRLVASVVSRNVASLAFHEARGFERVGCLKGVCCDGDDEDEGSCYDLVLFQKAITP
jgi:L-amino acid N-acyltransferase YncA